MRVVRNLESDEREVLGFYVETVEDSVFYRLSDGGLASAPEDCVRVEDAMWEEVPVPSPSVLHELLVGKRVRMGDSERGMREFRMYVNVVRGIVVGLDANGMFSAVRVQLWDKEDNGERAEVLLYADGSVASAATDEWMGSHSLKATSAGRVAV